MRQSVSCRLPAHTPRQGPLRVTALFVQLGAKHGVVPAPGEATCPFNGQVEISGRGLY